MLAHSFTYSLAPSPVCCFRPLFGMQVKKKSMTAFERDRLLSKVVGLTSADPVWLKHFGRADIVIEAVPENLALKHKVVSCGIEVAFSAS